MSTITTQPSAECRRVAPSNAVLAPSHIDIDIMFKTREYTLCAYTVSLFVNCI